MSANIDCSARASKSHQVIAAAVEGLECRQMLCGLAHEQMIEAPEWSEAVEQQYADAREGGPEAVSIVWSNRGQTSDGFAEAFGTSAAAGRLVVDAALRHWERVITSFNRSDGTSTLQVNVSMARDKAGNLVGGFGGAGAPAATAPADGKPRTGSFTLNAGNMTADPNDSNGWYFDQNPDDWSEFNGSIINAYAANPTTSLGGEFYSVAVAELAHVLGLISDKYNAGGAWNGYRLETSGMVSPTNIRDHAEGGGTFGYFWIFNGPTIDHLMTGYNSGDADNASWGNVIHTAGGAGNTDFNNANFRGAEDVGNAAGAGERTIPSYSVAQILADAYGYTIADPEQFGTMHASLNQSNGVLTIRGSSSATSSDLIILDQVGQDLVVTVDIGEDVPGTGPLPGGGNIDGYTSRFPASSVNSIVVNAGGGNDFIRLESSTGRPVTINGEAGDDIIDFGFYSRNLGNNATGNIHVTGGPGYNQVYAYDDANPTAHTYTITSGRFDRPAWGGFSYAADLQALNLVTGTAANTVNVLSTFSNQPIYLFSAGGSDTINIGSTINGIRSIAANVFVGNNPSTTTLNINNGPDTGARTWNVDRTGNFGYLVGMAPAIIYWDNSDISSINLTCGSGLDTGQFVISTETFNLNNTGGNDSIRIGVPAAQGLQLISGQITIDNTPATTALSIDDTGSSIARTLTIDEGGGYNTVVGFGPLIRFDNADTNTTIITGSASDTVNVLRNDDTLVINSSGGNDVVNIGNTTNGVQAITGELTVRNTPSTSTVNINNGPDTIARTVSLQNVTAGSDILGRWTGLAPAFINYRYLDVSAVNVTFGSAADSILLRQSQKDLNLSTTGGIDAYAIGGSSNGAQSILGNITLQNPPSRNNFHVDNLGDTTARTAILDDVTIGGFAYGQLTGLAPATISWKHADTTGITLTGGSGADRFFVNEFKSGNNLAVFGGNGNDELYFGNGNLAANITVGTFNFDGQAGTADRFVMENALAPSSEGWNYGVDGPGLSASRVVGGVYNLVLPKQNVEQSVFNGNSGDENMVITAVAVGESFAFNGGAGADGVFLPVNVSTAIRGPIILDGGAGPGNTISQTTNSSAAATTLHVTANTIGAHAGDNFFGAGGSVQFSNFNSAVLTMGTGADTVYVRPNTTTTFNIRGGNPGTAPGDRLNFGLAGVTNPVFAGNAANGNLTSSNFARVDYSFFETGPTVDSTAPAGQTATANINGAPPVGGGANRFAVDVTFNDSVAGLLTGSSITVLNLQTELTVPAANIAAEFVTASNTARFTFPGLVNGALPDGDYLATVSGNLTDLFGNPLSAIPSVSFFSFAGDANRDRAVNIGDFSILASRFNVPGTFTQGDFNYNGSTEIGDFAILASKFNTNLPAPSALPRLASQGDFNDNGQLADPPLQLRAAGASRPSPFATQRLIEDLVDLDEQRV